MKILAIESSGKVASVAIYHDEIIEYEESLGNQLTHSQILMPMVERALEACDYRCEDMDAFAVNIGPGSFTGLRIGICSANALGMAWNKPVIGIDSLSCLAANASEYGGLVCPMIDARNDQVYAGVFQFQNKKLKMIQPLFSGAVSEWIETLPEGEKLFLGDGATAQREVLEEAFAEVSLAMAHNMNHRAAALAALAAQKAAKAEWDEEVMPLYLRKSQAERLKEGD